MRILPIAASSPFKVSEYEAGKKLVESRGYEFVRDASLRTASQSYLNGSDRERLQELEEALASTKADLIWAVRGGYGITRLLPGLPAIALAKAGPVVVGISDVTALTCHLWARFKRKSLHAPVLARINQEPPEVLAAIDLILKGQAHRVKYPVFTSPFEKGGLRGILIPVNLSMLTELIGTPSMPNLQDAILLLEDANEEPYRLDRMLTHLGAAGVLKGVRAIIVGHLTACGDNPEAVFLERCAEFKIPCFTGFPMGHESPNWPVPVGVKAEITVNGSKACLKILEELI